METKKSKSAELESKRSSFLIIGLVCATSLALMSFEYATFNLVSNDIASEKKDIALDNDILEIQSVEVEKPAPPKAPEQVNNEIIDATEKVEIIPIEPIEPVDPTDPTDPTIVFDPTVIPILDTVQIKVPEKGPKFTDEFTVVEEMPEFPGGLEGLYKYLNKNTKYPTQSKNMGKEGKVYVSFVIEKDGSLSNIEIVKGVEKNLDKEAIRVIQNMPNWKPGKQRNQLVRVRLVQPISFELK